MALYFSSNIILQGTLRQAITRDPQLGLKIKLQAHILQKLLSSRIQSCKCRKIKTLLYRCVEARFHPFNRQKIQLSPMKSVRNFIFLRADKKSWICRGSIKNYIKKRKQSKKKIQAQQGDIVNLPARTLRLLVHPKWLANGLVVGTCFP